MFRPLQAGSPASVNISDAKLRRTNEDFVKAVMEKRFRQDLLYRLQDFTITLPPLRDCGEDVMPLAEFFREQSNKTLDKAVKGFDSSAKKALLQHPWSGNVRVLCGGNKASAAKLLKIGRTTLYAKIKEYGLS